MEEGERERDYLLLSFSYPRNLLDFIINLQEYLKEPLSASVHMIHTLCTDQDRRKLCIDTICRYVSN